MICSGCRCSLRQAATRRLPAPPTRVCSSQPALHPQPLPLRPLPVHALQQPPLTQGRPASAPHPTTSPPPSPSSTTTTTPPAATATAAAAADSATTTAWPIHVAQSQAGGPVGCQYATVIGAPAGWRWWWGCSIPTPGGSLRGRRLPTDGALRSGGWGWGWQRRFLLGLSAATAGGRSTLAWR